MYNLSALLQFKSFTMIHLLNIVWNIEEKKHGNLKEQIKKGPKFDRLVSFNIHQNNKQITTNLNIEYGMVYSKKNSWLYYFRTYCLTQDKT